MTEAGLALRARLSKLPESDRAELAYFLLETLDAKPTREIPGLPLAPALGQVVVGDVERVLLFGHGALLWRGR